MSKRLLIIEDEPGLVVTLRDRFKNEFYDVETVTDGREGCKRALAQEHDVIILDLMLPSMDGLEICKRVRSKGVQTPILMLTAKGQVLDKVLGLKLGADDYLPKPFEFMELQARVEALLRRSQTAVKIDQSEFRIQVGDLAIDLENGTILFKEKELECSAKEFQLLAYLAKHHGKVISREELLNEVWGYESMPSTRTVDTHIAWLRGKLEENPKYPKYLMTVHGRGYKLVV